MLLVLLGCGDDSAATDAGTDTTSDGSVDSGVEYQMHDEIRVEADDGSATLIIAPNSLPVGVDASEIRVVAGAVATIDEDAEFTLLAGYELRPDGLVFREPAELQMAADTAIVPFGLLIGSANATPVAVRSADPTPESGRFSLLTAEIPHFSSLLFAYHRAPPEVRSRGLGATFQFGPTEDHFSFTPPIEARLSLPVVREGREIGFSFLLLRGTVQFVRTEHQRVEPVGPPHEPVPYAPSMRPSWDATYLCTEPGEMSAVVVGFFDLEYEITIDGSAPITRTVRATATTTTTGECMSFVTDPEDDCVDSEGSGIECSHFDDTIDIYGMGLSPRALPVEDALALFGNTAYPCDEFGGGLRTVCRATPGAFAEGAMWVGTMVLGTDVPDNDPDHSLIYSLVFDSDNDPANDWIPVDPFVWDYFQATDRWYQLIWNHLTRTWTVTVTQVDASQTQVDVPSAVRVVIVQNAVTFFIPVTELPSATPAYRFSAFAHDGSFSRTDRGGDVSGVDPTVPPQMFMP